MCVQCYYDERMLQFSIRYLDITEVYNIMCKIIQFAYFLDIKYILCYHIDFLIKKTPIRAVNLVSSTTVNLWKFVERELSWKYLIELCFVAMMFLRKLTPKIRSIQFIFVHILTRYRDKTRQFDIGYTMEQCMYLKR
jgi:hypothetical protein